MRRIVIFLLFLVPAFLSEARGVQGSRFGHVAECNDSVFGISTTIPNGFVEGQDIMTMIQYAPNVAWGEGVADSNSNYLYCATAMSKDRECMVLYPYLIFAKKYAERPFAFCQTQFLSECSSAKADNGAAKVVKLSDAEAKQWGNADTVYIVDFPQAKPLVKRYTHCVAIYMAKAGRTPIFLKLLFTDKGYVERTAVINKVKGCMRYTDGAEADNNKVTLDSNRLLKIHKHKVIPLLHGEPAR